MYDKYQTGNTFSIGTTKLPKHKGFLFNGTGTVSFYLVNDTGNTFAYSIGFTGGSNILPMNAYSVTSLGGITGIYLN
jgi:hypothetical protein